MSETFAQRECVFFFFFFFKSAAFPLKWEQSETITSSACYDSKCDYRVAVQNIRRPQTPGQTKTCHRQKRVENRTPNGAFCRRMYQKAKAPAAFLHQAKKNAAMRENYQRKQNSGEGPHDPHEGVNHGKGCIRQERNSFEKFANFFPSDLFTFSGKYLYSYDLFFLTKCTTNPSPIEEKNKVDQLHLVWSHYKMQIEEIIMTSNMS